MGIVVGQPDQTYCHCGRKKKPQHQECGECFAGRTAPQRNFARTQACKAVEQNALKARVQEEIKKDLTRTEFSFDLEGDRVSVRINLAQVVVVVRESGETIMNFTFIDDMLCRYHEERRATARVEAERNRIAAERAAANARQNASKKTEHAKDTKEKKGKGNKKKGKSNAAKKDEGGGKKRGKNR